ncbi:phenylalanine--tRNA ligase subunit beta [Nocardioides mesophilus]|uniref:Phenylalanine--tRNA ligase beta subunit n=1 Tax=Nocardioides mesophilus TaxID=433659 RepID=A0A7G9RAH1_9ACTN|nr:phenylalanine--tRNA ligase subunit beta [Nocardioides mesophilus]QNN52596.1 phenylalanine--tRNA ligase subunit beta [Nocardioides mesophilus]
MRAPLSWIREYVDLPADVDVVDLTHRLTALGLKLEALEAPGADIEGPLVAGRVLRFVEEPQKNGKTIRWCQVDVGPEHNGEEGHRGIVCGALNFAEGDLVVVSLPGAVLPGGFAIAARKTYGHVSDGMICSTRELGIGEDHGGILVLDPRIDGDVKPGDDVVGLLGLRDDVIEFEINPDRAYALSLRGIAREAALAYGVAFHDPAHREVPGPDGRGYPVRVEAPDGCPVFVTRTVTGFDPAAPTPRHIARRVQLGGMRPISLAVDITNYVMLELGQPIHGYDGDRLQGPIVVRRAAPGERLTTLDDVSRTLSEEDLLITDDSGPIGIAGVMGGQTTELSGTTSHVVIEAAHFAPATIYRTSRRHKLPSEASKRFERGVDPLLPAYAADRVAALLVEHGGGVVEAGVTYVGSPPPQPEIKAALDLPARVTGMPIEAAGVVEHLRAVGCSVHVDGETLTALPPSWRPDLQDPYDLVEEVARLVGYTEVPSVLPSAPAGRGLTREQRLRRRVGFALAGAGLVEVKAYPFVGESHLDDLGLPADDERRRTLRVANPLSDERPLLTTTLLPGLLEATARNLGRGAASVALYETDLVFLPGADAAAAPILGVERRPSPEELDSLERAVPDQPRHLGVVLVGERERSGWWGHGRPAGWADAIAAVREVARVLRAPLTVHAAVRPPWHPGRCAELRVGDHVVGHAGELHPRVCAAFGLPARSAAAEVDLDALVAAAIAPTAPRFSGFPVAKEDVALVVAADVPAADVAETLREGAGELLESVRLFDVYTGEQIEAGKKSLAFALRFRAPDRTLTESEIAAARDAAIALAAQRHGAVHRG